MEKKDIIQIATSMDWEEVESKNPHMLSFISGDKRLNLYFTTMTATIQSPELGCITVRDVSPEEFENILEKYYARE